MQGRQETGRMPQTCRYQVATSGSTTRTTTAQAIIQLGSGQSHVNSVHLFR